MFCKKCGSRIEKDNVSFCSNCGAKVSKKINLFKTDTRPADVSQKLQKLPFSLNSIHIGIKGLLVCIIILCLGIIALLVFNGKDNSNKADQDISKNIAASSQISKSKVEKEDTKSEAQSTTNANMTSGSSDQVQNGREKMIFERAEQVVTDYVEALDINDFRRVYELMSPRKREEVGPYNEWVKGFTEPESRIKITRVEAIRTYNDKVLVEYDVSIKDNEYKPWRHKTGVARVMMIGNTATLDDINNQ